MAQTLSLGGEAKVGGVGYDVKSGVVMCLGYFLWGSGVRVESVSSSRWFWYGKTTAVRIGWGWEPC